MTTFAYQLMALLVGETTGVQNVRHLGRGFFSGVQPAVLFGILGGVLLVMLALLVVFVIRGQSWDQRRMRLWSTALPGGTGRRATDQQFLRASPGGPFRQKPGQF